MKHESPNTGGLNENNAIAEKIRRSQFEENWFYLFFILFRFGCFTLLITKSLFGPSLKNCYIEHKSYTHLS